ncbi:MAG: hypothetical protein ACHQFZ_07345 [Acidimicrobiales bacterium]
MGSGVVALLGSGETGPGMTKIHRELLSRLSEVRAVNLDSAYGFQLNVPQMTEKLADYFSTSLQTTLEPLSLTSYEAASEVQRALFKQRVRAASYVFAGPGSPSWALTQWRPLGLTDELQAVLAHDGVVCFASAAALTLGAFTAPIYEVYKVGVPEPYWLDGLDLMGRLGLRCAVIPHFDNREGRNYDTRYCYLGEPRLLALEAQLPEGVGVLGVDEHTALLIDLDARTVTVKGRGNAYWRLAGRATVLEKGPATALDDLRNVSPAPPGPAVEPSESPPSHGLEDLADQVARGGPGAIESLAQLVHRASQGVAGRIDPTDLVDAVLRVRATARERGQYELADQLRDALVGAGVDVRDDPRGSTWSLR